MSSALLKTITTTPSDQVAKDATLYTSGWIMSMEISRKGNIFVKPETDFVTRNKYIGFRYFHRPDGRFVSNKFVDFQSHTVLLQQQFVSCYCNKRRKQNDEPNWYFICPQRKRTLLFVFWYEKLESIIRGPILIHYGFSVECNPHLDGEDTDQRLFECLIVFVTRWEAISIWEFSLSG